MVLGPLVAAKEVAGDLRKRIEKEVRVDEEMGKITRHNIWRVFRCRVIESELRLIAKLAELCID